MGAIRAGKLQCRVASMHGNPWFRLRRREVEALVRMKRGAGCLAGQQARTELAKVNRELEKLNAQVALLEERKAKLMEGSGGTSKPRRR